MSTELLSRCVHQIGKTAGKVWNQLDRNGPMSMTALTKGVNEPRDMVMQAVGWLAREEKIDIVETKRGRIVSLR